MRSQYREKQGWHVICNAKVKGCLSAWGSTWICCYICNFTHLSKRNCVIAFFSSLHMLYVFLFIFRIVRVLSSFGVRVRAVNCLPFILICNHCYTLCDALVLYVVCLLLLLCCICITSMFSVCTLHTYLCLLSSCSTSGEVMGIQTILVLAQQNW